MDSIPEHFPDDELLTITHTSTVTTDPSSNSNTYHKYYPSIGLLLKLYKGLKRLWKRGRMIRPEDNGETLLYILWEHYRAPHEHVCSEYWTPNQLFSTAIHLNRRCREISPLICRDLDHHLLLPPTHDGEVVTFEPSFLSKVESYLKSLERPPGTFDAPDEVKKDCDSYDGECSELIKRLAALPREACPKCGGQRQVYCGECGGLRMPSASPLLPPRVSLPFRVHLLLHWRESLHKCTGIHAAVLCEEDTISYSRWRKDGEESISECPWEEVVRSFDAERDLLVYPTEEAIPADKFPWSSDPSSPTSSVPWRLVLLEGSWEGAKTMARRIISLRSELSLPPLRCISLQGGVTGRYWRLQHMGASAVSTIEALAHVADVAARSVDTESSPCHLLDAMLLLFNLQRYRVFENVKGGARVPLAMAASNSSDFETSWAASIRRHGSVVDQGGVL